MWYRHFQKKMMWRRTSGVGIMMLLVLVWGRLSNGLIEMWCVYIVEEVVVEVDGVFKDC